MFLRNITTAGVLAVIACLWSERYRIPKELRDAEAEEQSGEQSWSSVVASQEEAARPGRPDSCSVVGTFGFTGCQSAIMRQWFDERRTGQ